ncbi:hypothetical protein DXG03_006087 [Asterophora parasitica]|uniref:WD40 repeat-like protein n=1 Tax=Asterophora parasitica TaxID=117018 RepID=A0A9P7KF30_9AGAR|nr:hypothetical protein DXG03_006087 [Asterophora parasitica]
MSSSSSTTRHRRHASHPGFSHLLTTVLGSPFLTTPNLELDSDEPNAELVDGAEMYVAHADTVTRPPSPTLTVRSSTFSFIASPAPGARQSTPNRLPHQLAVKSIPARIWDVLSPHPRSGSPSSFGSPSSLGSPPYGYAYSYEVDYSGLAPLDGEEGELIALDDHDEACFFIDSGARAVTGIDILTLLPPELALHILCLLFSPVSPLSPEVANNPATSTTVTAATTSTPPQLTAAESKARALEQLRNLQACRAVSRTWRALASDNTVWRALFLARWPVDLSQRRLVDGTSHNLVPYAHDQQIPAPSPSLSASHNQHSALPTPTLQPQSRSKLRASLSLAHAHVQKKRRWPRRTGLSSPSLSPLSSASSFSGVASQIQSQAQAEAQPRAQLREQSRYQFPATSPSPTSTSSASVSVSSSLSVSASSSAPSILQPHPHSQSQVRYFSMEDHASPQCDPGKGKGKDAISIKTTTGNPLLETHTPPPLAQAPLQLDWHTLYRARLELDWRWVARGTSGFVLALDPTSALRPSHTPAPPATTASQSTPTHTASQSTSTHTPLTVSQCISTPTLTPFSPTITTLAAHTDSVYCVEFNRARIVTGSRDRTIRVWSLRTGRMVGCFGVGVSGGGMAAGAPGGHGGVGEAPGGLVPPAHGPGVGQMAALGAVAPAAPATVGSGGGEAGVGGSRTGDELPQMRLQGHLGSVLCLKFYLDWDDGDGCSDSDADVNSDTDTKTKKGFMVSGSSDCTVCVWDLWLGKRLPILDSRKSPPALAQGDAPDEREREVKGAVRGVLRGHAGGVLDIRICERWIVSCSKDALIRIWDRNTLALVRTLRGHEGPVNAVGLQTGKVVSASGDGRMILWDIESGERIRTFEGHDRGLACIEFKEDLIVSGSNDCKIKVWSASTGECLRTLVGHESLVRALAFDPRTRRLVSASYDRSVKVWDLDTGKLVQEFPNAHSSHIFDVKFDIARIISSSHDQKITIIDFSQGLDTSLFV